MASKKEINEAIKTLGPLATVLQKSASELWKIFVWRYRAIGIALAVSGLLMMSGSVWLFGAHSHWLVLPALAAIPMWGWAMYLLINPYYPAMNDVVNQVKNLSKPPVAEVQLQATHRYPF